MNIEEFLNELKEKKSLLSNEAQSFLEYELTNYLKDTKDLKLTANGEKIIKAMQDNYNQYNNNFTSKLLGELLFTAPRSISGSMKKLILDGLVRKDKQETIVYHLTELGQSFLFDN